MRRRRDQLELEPHRRTIAEALGVLAYCSTHLLKIQSLILLKYSPPATSVSCLLLSVRTVSGLSFSLLVLLVLFIVPNAEQAVSQRCAARVAHNTLKWLCSSVSAAMHSLLVQIHFVFLLVPSDDRIGTTAVFWCSRPCVTPYDPRDPFHMRGACADRAIRWPTRIRRHARSRAYGATVIGSAIVSSVPRPDVELSVTLPPRSLARLRITSMPTPRPDTDVTACAVENPG